MRDYDKNDKQFNMTAVCGIYCGECECHKAKDNPDLINYLVNAGIKAEALPCPGCRGVDGNCPALNERCDTYKCATQKGVSFCYECSDFPCERLNPASDRANVLPHNLKVFNLSYIEKQGLDAFVEQSGLIKQRYFKGKMAIGKGPQID